MGGWYSPVQEQTFRPRKECIKSCETCFAKNALDLNDESKHKMSLFLKVLWPFDVTLSIWPWLRISPSSSLNVIYSVIITAWQWLMLLVCPVFLCKLNPIKAHWGTDSRPFSSERLAIFLTQADHILVDLFSSMVAWGSSVGRAPPQCRCVYLYIFLLSLGK